MKKLIYFLIPLFLFIPKVNAATFAFAGKTVDSTFSVSANGGYVQGQGYFTIPSDNAKSYVVMTYCSTAPLTLFARGISPSKVADRVVILKTNNNCDVSGYNGSYYQAYLNVLEWDDAGSGNKGITLDSSIFNYATYNAAVVFVQYGVTDSVPFDISSNEVNVNIDLTTTNQQLSDLNSNVIWSYQVNEEQNRKIDETNEKLDDIQDTLNDDDIDETNTTDTLEDLAEDLPTNSVISDLLLLPVRLFQNILNSINGTCSSFNLGSLYGSNLTLPCINIQSLIGSTLWSVIDILFCGAFILVIRKKFVDIFENLTELRNGGNAVE